MIRGDITTVAGALIIAAAILVALHWQIEVTPGGVVYVLDRWTGHVSQCEAVEPNPC